MTIGIDLDNTLICYDHLFHKIAVEQNWISPSVPLTKSHVKSTLLRDYGNSVWTELQGLVYGERLSEAQPYPEALEFFKRCRDRGYVTCIISHKTQYPTIGPRQDLRKAALEWLGNQGWFQKGGLCLANIEFTETRKAKVAAIRRRNCEVFLDDLPEVFQEVDFPRHTRRYLFDPNGNHPQWTEGIRVESWRKFHDFILSDFYDNAG